VKPRSLFETVTWLKSTLTTWKTQHPWKMKMDQLMLFVKSLYLYLEVKIVFFGVSLSLLSLLNISTIEHPRL